MTEIKICGITNLEDALAAAACGVDALGFIFFPKSPRYVAPEAAKNIIDELPKEIITIGVFVNQDAQAVGDIRERCGLDLIQLHGDEDPEYCRGFPPSLVIKAVFPRAEADLERFAEYPVRALLVDRREGVRYGGTGKLADWGLAAKIAKNCPVVLAGGLNAATVQGAIAAVLPQAVDINSGVEVSPGKKDAAKIKNIVTIIRQATPAGNERGARTFERLCPCSPKT